MSMPEHDRPGGGADATSGPASGGRAVAETAVAETAEDFFGLRRRGPHAWTLAVDQALCSGTGALFGGAAIGAAIAALEQTTGRSLVWTSVQFVSHVRPPATLTLDVEEVARGARASQARLRASFENQEIFTVVASLGHLTPDRLGPLRFSPPPVPPPELCPPRQLRERHRGRFMERTEARLALAGESGSALDGRSALWARIPTLLPGAATLGVFGDYVPFGVRQAFGEALATHSLDNSLRVLRRPSPGWVLADVHVHGVEGGFGYGHVHLWTEDGVLLGTASQSFTCRPRHPAPDL